MNAEYKHDVFSKPAEISSSNCNCVTMASTLVALKKAQKK